jgi:hypothetical protein
MQQDFLNAYEATDPKQLNDFLIDLGLDIWLPFLDVFSALLQGKQELFNERLEEALLLHKKHWDSNTPLNPGDPPIRDCEDSFVSLDLSYLCALAFDRGWNITVASDYIPKWLYEGQFLKK